MEKKNRKKFSDRDCFQRENIAQNIYTLYKNSKEVFPIALNGGWGTGKSEFAEKLISLIENNEKTEKNPTKCIYI